MKKEGLLERFLLGFLGCLVIVCFFSLAKAETTEKWSEIRLLWQKAISTMTRVSVGGNPEDFFDQAKSLPEKEEIIRLWILSVDGSYTDCILPGLGEYIALFNSAIRKAKTDSERRALFSSEVNGLVKILAALDTQIKAYADFKKLATRDFNVYLEKQLKRKPTKAESDNMAYGLNWEGFVKTKPIYGKEWPGFFSTQIEVQKGNRSYDCYHFYEIEQLKGIKIPKKLSVQKYEAIIKNLSGRFGDIIWNVLS